MIARIESPSTSRIGLAIALLVGLAGDARADGPDRTAPPLDQEMSQVADGIKRLLDGRGLDAIAVGAFTGPERATSSGGAGIKRALAEQLKAIGVRVDKRAELEVKGDYLDAQDRQSGLVVLSLKARVLDRAGAEVAQFQRSLFDVAAIGALLGTTIQLPPLADEKVRDKKLRDDLENPPFRLTGTRISTTGSPYAIEVLVKSRGEYRPRPAEMIDGLAFVAIKRDEVYAIRLINDSLQDAAVSLSIDGLSAFSFSEVKTPQGNRPKYGHYIVPKRETVDGKVTGGEGDVLGWHIKDSGPDSTDSFLITEYAKSASAELSGSVGDIGTITASFAAAWPKGTPPPADEPDAAARQNGRSGDATGRGPRVGVEYKPVERELGVVRTTISVRYTK